MPIDCITNIIMIHEYCVCVFVCAAVFVTLVFHSLVLVGCVEAKTYTQSIAF